MEEEHPLGHHHQPPSAAKLIHRAFSGCKLKELANLSKARMNKIAVGKVYN
jgi:hypothetical protein